MKKLQLILFMIFTLSRASFADCNDLIFGEPSKGNMVVSYSAYYATKAKLYKDKKGEYQFLRFNDAYGEFFSDMQQHFEKECKDGKYLQPVNVKVDYVIDKDYYYFTAMSNFEKKR